MEALSVRAASSVGEKERGGEGERRELEREWVRMNEGQAGREEKDMRRHSHTEKQRERKKERERYRERERERERYKERKRERERCTYLQE